MNQVKIKRYWTSFYVNLKINACGESIFNHALTSRDNWLLEKLRSKGADIGRQGVLLHNPFDHSIAKRVFSGAFFTATGISLKFCIITVCREILFLPAYNFNISTSGITFSLLL